MTGVHIYYPPGSRTKYKLTNNRPATESCRGEPTPLGSLDSVAANGLSVYAECQLSLSPRASGPSARRVSADLQSMTHTNPARNYVRTPRVAQVEQWAFFYPFHPKPQYSSTKNNHWNSGTMRIRYCGLEDMVLSALLGVSVIERYAFCIVPPFHRRKNTPQSCGFGWNGSKTGHCSTRANISGVIV